MSNCIVTGGSGNDTAPIGVLLLNLKETQSWIDHVVIYHDGGISSKDQCVMTSILPVEFVKYKFPGDTGEFNEIIKYYYSEMVFCKYECFKLLERFDNVLWTDYDVLFLVDVKELVDEVPTGFRSFVYASDHPVGTLRRQFRYGSPNDLEDLFDLDKPSIATGLLVASRNLRNPGELYKTCIAYTEKYANRLSLPEQAIFDMAFQQHHVTPEAISWNYAVHPVQDAERLPNAKILHCYAQPKFWNGLKNETWQELYNRWLSMGGSSWKKEGLFRKLRRSVGFTLHKLGWK